MLFTIDNCMIKDSRMRKQCFAIVRSKQNWSTMLMSSRKIALLSSISHFFFSVTHCYVSIFCLIPSIHPSIHDNWNIRAVRLRTFSILSTTDYPILNKNACFIGCAQLIFDHFACKLYYLTKLYTSKKK